MTCPHRGSGVRRLAHAATVHRTHPEQIALLPHEGRARSMFVADATRTNGEGSFSSSSASTPAVAAKRRRPERRELAHINEPMTACNEYRFGDMRRRALPNRSPVPSALNRSRHSSRRTSPTISRDGAPRQALASVGGEAACRPGLEGRLPRLHRDDVGQADLQPDYVAAAV